MKPLRIMTACLLMMSFWGCTKQVSEDLTHLEVDRYIELLKIGKFHSIDLPTFTWEDIPALLEYRDDAQVINHFPRNGISSYSMTECSLGMYALWTIESIRAVATDSPYLIGRFPSQNPIVQQRQDPFNLESGVNIQAIVSEAYFDWWEINKQKHFDEFKQFDPLSQTDYRWH